MGTSGEKPTNPLYKGEMQIEPSSVRVYKWKPDAAVPDAVGGWFSFVFSLRKTGADRIERQR
jgi:hypothetical protein